MKAAIFAHFDKHGIIDDYVLYSLRSYRQYFDHIVFVSASGLNNEQENRGLLYSDIVISKINTGYDFISWRCGFENLPNAEYDEITFINDSCYGPCSNVANMFHKASNLDADLLGVSINTQFRPHVQSFMMSFRKNLIRSGFAKDFWRSIEYLPDKFEIIMKYEIGLSEKVEQHGFKIGSLHKIDNQSSDLKERVFRDNMSEFDSDYNEYIKSLLFDNDTPNPMQMYWKEALRNDVPLLKIELFRKNPLKVNTRNILNYLKYNKWYDVSLIRNHLERVSSPDEFSKISNMF